MSTDLTITLQPVSEAHQPICYQIAAANVPGWLRVCKEGLPSPLDFEASLWGGVHAQFLVVADPDLVLGLAAVHSYSPMHRTAWVDVALAPSVRGDDREAVGDAALELILSHAFASVGLRCAHLLSPVWLQPQLDTQRWSIVREGLLREHLYHDGIYWDVGVWTVRVPAASGSRNGDGRVQGRSASGVGR
ncbi:MAG: GNAT family protein [Microthrixaceae bacterium]